jgi:hypothetical protein
MEAGLEGCIAVRASPALLSGSVFLNILRFLEALAVTPARCTPRIFVLVFQAVSWAGGEKRKGFRRDRKNADTIRARRALRRVETGGTFSCESVRYFAFEDFRFRRLDLK